MGPFYGWQLDSINNRVGRLSQLLGGFVAGNLDSKWFETHPSLSGNLDLRVSRLTELVQ